MEPYLNSCDPEAGCKICLLLEPDPDDGPAAVSHDAEGSQFIPGAHANQDMINYELTQLNPSYNGPYNPSPSNSALRSSQDLALPAAMDRNFSSQGDPSLFHDHSGVVSLGTFVPSPAVLTMMDWNPSCQRDPTFLDYRGGVGEQMLFPLRETSTSNPVPPRLFEQSLPSMASSSSAKQLPQYDSGSTVFGHNFIDQIDANLSFPNPLGSGSGTDSKAGTSSSTKMTRGTRSRTPHKRSPNSCVLCQSQKGGVSSEFHEHVGAISD